MWTGKKLQRLTERYPNIDQIDKTLKHTVWRLLP